MKKLIVLAVSSFLMTVSFADTAYGPYTNSIRCNIAKARFIGTPTTACYTVGNQWWFKSLH